MATITLSGNRSDATGLNSSPSVSLTGAGGASGVINSVYARLNFSTSAYSNTYSVVATLYFSGGSVQTTRSVKMDSSNYTNAPFDFYFYGLTAEQVNSISSVQAYCGTNGTKIFMKGNQYAYIDYTVPTKVGAPTAVSLDTSVTTNSTVTLSWSGAANGVANSITGYQIEYCDSSDGSYFGSWYAMQTYNTSYTYGSISAALPSARKWRKFRIRVMGSQGEAYYSSYVESPSVLRTSAPTTPSNVSAVPSVWETGNVTITWSASTATGQTISRYYLQYRLKRYGASYGSWTNLANTTDLTYSYMPPLDKGDQIQYRVRALSSDSVYSDYSSTVTVEMETEKATNLLPAAGWYVSLPICSWTPPAEISYCRYRTSIDGGATWGNFVNLSAGVNSFDPASVFSGMNAGSAFQYQVVGVASNGDTTDPAYSALLYKNTAPLAPEMLAPASADCISNGKMLAVFHLPDDPNVHAIKLQYKKNDGEWQDVIGLTATQTGFNVAVTITASAVYSFRITDEHGAPSTETTMTVTIQVETFTDSPIKAGTTRIKAIHLTELRSAIETLCTLYGVSAPSWEEDIVAGTTSIKEFPDHIAEIREKLSDIYTKINQLYGATLVAIPNWSASLVDTQPRAVAVEEIRNAIKNI
jgi:hypothetical protein